MITISVLDGYTMNPGDLSWEGFEALGELRYFERSSMEQRLERARGAVVVVVNKVVMDRELLLQLPELRCICVSATGYNNIDLETANELGIIVCNVKGYSTPSVAQHVFAMLLYVNNRIGYYNNSVQMGRWYQANDFSYWDHPILELADKKMGVLGFGKIGQAVASLALAFGMKVLAMSKYPERDQMEGVEMVSIRELLERSDVVSLHVPLTKQTHHLINKESIGWMKEEAILINTGRGPLIEEQDLAEALKANRIKAALLDVLSIEPPLPDHPLVGLSNCIISPHIAWAGQAARRRLMKGVEENIMAYLDGKPQNVVNEKGN